MCSCKKKKKKRLQFIFKQSLEKKINHGFVLFYFFFLLLLCDKSIKENKPDLKLEQGTRSEEMQQNSKYNPAKRKLKQHTFPQLEKYNIM